MSPQEATSHLENLRRSHEITRELQAANRQPSIGLHVHRDGWCAVFRNIPDMPDATLPLPWTCRASASTVAADIARRFPGASIVVRI